MFSRTCATVHWYGVTRGVSSSLAFPFFFFNLSFSTLWWVIIIIINNTISSLKKKITQRHVCSSRVSDRLVSSFRAEQSQQSRGVDCMIYTASRRSYLVAIAERFSSRCSCCSHTGASLPSRARPFLFETVRDVHLYIGRKCCNYPSIELLIRGK